MNGSQVLVPSIALGAAVWAWSAVGLLRCQNGFVLHVHKVHITHQIKHRWTQKWRLHIHAFRQSRLQKMLCWIKHFGTQWTSCTTGAFEEGGRLFSSDPGGVHLQIQFRNPVRSMKWDPFGKSPWSQSCCFNMSLNSTPSVSFLMSWLWTKSASQIQWNLLEGRPHALSKLNRAIRCPRAAMILRREEVLDKGSVPVCLLGFPVSWKAK